MTTKSVFLGGAVSTAYMHLARCHVGDMIESHHSIARYSNHALESLHALNKKLLRTRTSKFKDYAANKALIAQRQLLAFYRVYTLCF